jgi:hypothetical protein
MSMVTSQLIRQSTQDFPVGIAMRQRTFSYLYAWYPLPSMIHPVSIKTSICCVKCCISSKYMKCRRLVTATKAVVPLKDTEMIVPSKVTEAIVPQKQPRRSFTQKPLRQSDILLACRLLLVLLQILVRWIIKMLFTFLLRS